MTTYYSRNDRIPAKPDNYLVWGILCTLMCCLPFGIVSIVKASQVDSLYAQGRYSDAYSASLSAKNWAMWGAIIAVAIYVTYILVYIALIIFSVAAPFALLGVLAGAAEGLEGL